MNQSSLTEYKGGVDCRQLTANKGKEDHKNTQEPWGGGRNEVDFIVNQKKKKTLGSPKSS